MIIIKGYEILRFVHLREIQIHQYSESEMEPVRIFDDRYRSKPVKPDRTGRSEIYSRTVFVSR